MDQSTHPTKTPDRADYNSSDIENELKGIAKGESDRTETKQDTDNSNNHIVKTSEAESCLENTNEELSLKKEFENNYTATVKGIIELSKENLKELRTDKIALREDFVNFFKQILGIQLIVLIAFLFFNSASVDFDISDKVLITFMSSIFAETLGCIILMIKYAFKSDEEVQIIKTLNAIVQKYQKFK